MFGVDRKQREAEWARQAVLDAVDYLTAEDDAALEHVVLRVEIGRLNWGVIQIASRAIAVLAETQGTTPAAVASRLGEDVLRVDS